MAKARSRRLRKKLHVGEFQEIGFDVDFSFKEGTDIQVIDTVVDEFIAFVEEQGLEFGGGGLALSVCKRLVNVVKRIANSSKNGLKAKVLRMSLLANYVTFGGTNLIDKAGFGPFFIAFISLFSFTLR